MEVQKLIEPAEPWADGRWLDRVDQAASFLFLHGYISQTQRMKVAQKLERELRAGIEQGRIITRQRSSDNG